MNYKNENIEERFKSLPKDIQFALTSVEVAEEMNKIANTHGLLLDKSAIIFDLTSDILLGLLKTKDFVRTLSKEAGLSEDSASAIAQDINKQIFDKLRSSMRKVEESQPIPDMEPDQPLSSLERVGGFSVEKEVVETENSDVTEADRGEILAGLENPQPRVATPGGNPPLNLPTDERSKGMPGAMATGASIGGTSSPRLTGQFGSTRHPNPTTPDNHTEPLVDYLLSKPAGQSTQKVSVEPASNSSNPAPIAPKRSGPDPYREPVK